ncbi:L,D-transpeptidase family protein [Thaumasiovibrio subtropicus]|uniref:L,D-transpeptidase family protein n=1 Tax=Thaumasiovibrio subtropicus TaxID=1891207 RepID=UPI000B362474|nr:L,D-transpeptidase [Thaumasiovibrio subtropicus]
MSHFSGNDREFWRCKVAKYLVALSVFCSTQVRSADIESLWVSKSHRQLHVYIAGEVVRIIPIKLGIEPEGPKRWRGDKRTPEGIYRISAKNRFSRFHLSLRIDYPNQKDKVFAERYDLDSGSDIYLHGLPNNMLLDEAFYQSEDWTEGCIAMSDDDIQYLFKHVDINTPIVIVP